MTTKITTKIAKQLLDKGETKLAREVLALETSPFSRITDEAEKLGLPTAANKIWLPNTGNRPAVRLVYRGTNSDDKFGLEIYSPRNGGLGYLFSDYEDQWSTMPEYPAYGKLRALTRMTVSDNVDTWIKNLPKVKSLLEKIQKMLDSSKHDTTIGHD